MTSMLVTPMISPDLLDPVLAKIAAKKVRQARKTSFKNIAIWHFPF